MNKKRAAALAVTTVVLVGVGGGAVYAAYPANDSVTLCATKRGTVAYSAGGSCASTETALTLATAPAARALSADLNAVASELGTLKADHEALEASHEAAATLLNEMMHPTLILTKDPTAGFGVTRVTATGLLPGSPVHLVMYRSSASTSFDVNADANGRLEFEWQGCHAPGSQKVAAGATAMIGPRLSTEVSCAD